MRVSLLLVLFLLANYSCSLTDNFSEEPMFLKIDSVDFVSSDNMISPSHKIQDVSVFVDGANIGVFEVPAMVPVLGEGQVSVTIFAGIRNNGVVLAPAIYPFYEREELTLDFEANKVVPLDLEFRYLPEAKFAFNENFEGALLFTVDLDQDDTSKLEKSQETPYGSFCGKINVTQETSSFQQGTAGLYQTDDFQGSEVYLELDYKCEVPFIIGYIGYDGSLSRADSFIALYESEEWNKVYLDMSLVLNGGEFETCQIFIAGIGNNEAGSIWVDNIRLLHL